MRLPERKPVLAPVIVNLDTRPKDSYLGILLLVLSLLTGLGAYYVIPFIRGLRLF